MLPLNHRLFSKRYPPHLWKEKVQVLKGCFCSRMVVENPSYSRDGWPTVMITRAYACGSRCSVRGFWGHLITILVWFAVCVRDLIGYVLVWTQTLFKNKKKTSITTSLHSFFLLGYRVLYLCPFGMGLTSQSIYPLLDIDTNPFEKNRCM